VWVRGKGFRIPGGKRDDRGKGVESNGNAVERNSRFERGKGEGGGEAGKAGYQLG
jgi:hypothetical protein